MAKFVHFQLAKSLQVTFFFLCRFSKFFLFSILLSKSLNTFKSQIFQVHRPFLIHILDFKHPQSPLFTLKIKVPQTVFPSNLQIDIVNLQVRKFFHISSSQTILNSHSKLKTLSIPPFTRKIKVPLTILIKIIF